jgi:hypothetical protein
MDKLTQEPQMKSKEKSLWDVTYEFPMFGIRTTIRVRAEEESDAHDFAVDFFTRLDGGPTTCAKPANRQRRDIFETTKSFPGWRWKPRQKRSVKRSDSRNSAAKRSGSEESKNE